MKTPEQIAEFLSQPDIEYIEKDTAQSFKSNILIHSENFEANKVFSNKLLSFVKNLYEQIISPVPQAVSRIKLLITSTLAINSFVTIIIQQISYKILRVNKYQIKITCITNPTWNVDDLIIQVKEIDGTFVLPTITTINNEINIYFLDEITANYNVIIL